MLVTNITSGDIRFHFPDIIAKAETEKRATKQVDAMQEIKEGWEWGTFCWRGPRSFSERDI